MKSDVHSSVSSALVSTKPYCPRDYTFKTESLSYNLELQSLKDAGVLPGRECLMKQCIHCIMGNVVSSVCLFFAGPILETKGQYITLLKIISYADLQRYKSTKRNPRCSPLKTPASLRHDHTNDPRSLWSKRVLLNMCLLICQCHFIVPIFFFIKTYLLLFICWNHSLGFYCCIVMK